MLELHFILDMGIGNEWFFITRQSPENSFNYIETSKGVSGQNPQG